MRHTLTFAVSFVFFIALVSRSQAYDHATIVGDFYNYQFCDSCDHSLYRHEETMYHVPYLYIGNGEAGVVNFDIPPEVEPFDHVQLHLFLNDTSFYGFPPPTFDISVNGFDGVVGNAGPSGLAGSIPIPSPYYVSRFDEYWSVDVTQFVRGATHPFVSFTITGNSTVWTMATPELLVFPVPEPCSITLVLAAAFSAISCRRKRKLESKVNSA